LKKLGLSFYYMVPNGREIVAHAIYANIKNIVLMLSIIGAVAGRNYAVTNIIS